MKKFSKFKKITTQKPKNEVKFEQKQECIQRIKRNTYLYVIEQHEKTIQRLKREFEKNNK